VSRLQAREEVLSCESKEVASVIRARLEPRPNAAAMRGHAA
jgi:hypothetical protein